MCSGGRYDSLATDGRTTYPGVGISIGLTRLVHLLVAKRGLTASRSTPAAVLVAVVDEESRDGVARGWPAALRARGIPCEVAPSAAKFGKQIRYADRRGIPFVWFPGAGGRRRPGQGHPLRRPGRRRRRHLALPADADLRPVSSPHAASRPRVRRARSAAPLRARAAARAWMTSVVAPAPAPPPGRPRPRPAAASAGWPWPAARRGRDRGRRR